MHLLIKKMIYIYASPHQKDDLYICISSLKILIVKILSVKIFSTNKNNSMKMEIEMRIKKYKKKLYKN